MASQLSLFFVLWKKEMRDIFWAPMIYILAALFSLLMGWLFFNYIIASQGQISASIARNQILVPLLGNMNFVFLFLAPLLTMGAFSLEKRQGTWPLLLNSKMSLTTIILAKILSALGAASFLLMPTLILPLILAIAGFDEWGMLATSYAGLFCSIACYIAVGVFTSTLSENPIVSALMSFSVLLILMLLVFSANLSENLIVGQIFEYTSVPFHFENFVRGVVKSFNIMYYCSFIFFFVFLTHHSLRVGAK